MDEMFKYFGPLHRRVRHHKQGVNEVQKIFGKEEAKAAIIHIVRDCGAVPDIQDYVNHKVNEYGFNNQTAPEYLFYDGLTETALQKFMIQVEYEWKKYLIGGMA